MSCFRIIVIVQNFFSHQLTSFLRSKFPYRQRFAMINKKEFKRHGKISGTLEPKAFNLWLQNLCGENMEEYICFVKVNKGMRFRLVTTKELEEMKRNDESRTQPQYRCETANGIRLLFGTTEVGPVCSQEKPCVSTWLKDKYSLHGELIDYRLLEIVDDIYGIGYGARDCSKSTGTTVFIGTRSTKMSNASVTEGEGVQDEHRYFRSLWRCSVLRAQFEKKVKSFAERLQKFTKRTDFSMNRLLQTEEYQARVLWTQGRKGSTSAFTNERHTDKRDALSRDHTDSIMSTLNKGYQKIQQDKSQNSEYTTKFVNYVKKVQTMVGLGYTTTNAYQYVFHPDVNKEEIVPVQFFVMPGLGSTCPIEDQSGHNFRADVFSHYTSMALIIVHGLVHWVSTGVVSIVAVGTWHRSVTVHQSIDDPYPCIEPVDMYDSIPESTPALSNHQFPEEVTPRRRKKTRKTDSKHVVVMENAPHVPLTEEDVISVLGKVSLTEEEVIPVAGKVFVGDGSLD